MNPEIIFALENAGWPAALVDAEGRFARANEAAIRLFGLEDNPPDASLARLWSEENSSSFSDFLETVGYSQIRHITAKFATRSDPASNFVVYACPLIRGSQKFFLFQLFKPSGAPTSAHRPEGPEHRPLPGDASAAIDPNVAHKQKLECAMQLARTVALDFNNALTTILGHASLLLGLTEADHPWRNSLVEMEKSAAKAAEIANDLANFSRQEKEARPQQVKSINALLQHCVDVFHAPENAHIEWTMQTERRLFGVTFDEAKLQQAFMKIFENAAQAIENRGGITVQTRNMELEEPFQDRTVKLSPGTFVCVEITDTGCGITPEALPRIFEPFFTTKGEGHRGLGLAWVYGIVTNHGGGVAVSSRPRQGTSVRVYLPAVKKVVKEKIADSTHLCGAETILFVDDEELLLNMAQMVLSSYGYRAFIARNGLQALQILEQETVDLVITDLVMPGMSGRELIERIRSVSPAAKIVCSSGYVRPQSDNEDESYLQKPFTAQELLQKVRETLDSVSPPV